MCFFAFGDLIRSGKKIAEIKTFEFNVLLIIHDNGYTSVILALIVASENRMSYQRAVQFCSSLFFNLNFSKTPNQNLNIGTIEGQTVKFDLSNAVEF